MRQTMKAIKSGSVPRMVRSIAYSGADVGERGLFEKLNDALQPAKLQVRDVSGGCGSMYAIEVASSKFAGLSVIKQQRMVNEILKEEIKAMHG